MRYKKRPKNKQELSPKSGARIKPVYREKINFQFESGEEKFKNHTGRLKISEEGYISFLIKKEGKWQPVKGKLLSLQVKKERIPVGFIKKNA